MLQEKNQHPLTFAYCPLSGPDNLNMAAFVLPSLNKTDYIELPHCRNPGTL